MPFDRLVRLMDTVAGEIDEEVVILKGVSDIHTERATSFKWLPNPEYRQLMKRARILVCHAGVGTIIDGLKLGKAVIVVPRRKMWREAIDDHQLEIARAASESGRVLHKESAAEILQALASNELANGRPSWQSRTAITDSIRMTLREIAWERGG